MKLKLTILKICFKKVKLQLLVVGEMQVKTTKRCYHLTSRNNKILKTPYQVYKIMSKLNCHILSCLYKALLFSLQVLRETLKLVI